MLMVTWLLWILTILGLVPGEGLGILGYGVMGVVGGSPVESDTRTRHALYDDQSNVSMAGIRITHTHTHTYTIEDN